MNILYKISVYLIILYCSLQTTFADTIIINPYRLVTPAFPYLINEDYEGTGTPVGWFNNASDPDYTASPLIGTQSLRLATDGNYYVYTGAALDHSEVFGKLRMRVDALPVSPPYSKLFIMADAGFAEVGLATLLADGRISFGAGGNEATTTDSIVVGTPYWVYFRVRGGSGGTGQIAAGFTTTEVRPTSGSKYVFTASNSGVPTGNVINFGYQASASAIVVYDNLQIAATIFD